jgi:hypothetical protein
LGKRCLSASHHLPDRRGPEIFLRWEVNWPAAIESGHVIKEITYLCRTFFGVEMVLIGKRLQ